MLLILLSLDNIPKLHKPDFKGLYTNFVEFMKTKKINRKEMLKSDGSRGATSLPPNEHSSTERSETEVTIDMPRRKQTHVDLITEDAGVQQQQATEGEKEGEGYSDDANLEITRIVEEEEEMTSTGEKKEEP